MFDPNKYDKTNSQKNTESFSEKRTKLIKYIYGFKPLIQKECEMLENHIKENPDSNAVSPFEDKLDGWSRILNGIEIVKKMYEVV